MKIQVLCGMIASGKTTYTRMATTQGIISVNDDAIVNMLHGDNYFLYDKNLKILYKSIENNIISTSLSFGKTVLVDRGLNVSKQGRQRWLALAKSFDVPCQAIIFKNEGPEVHAKRRHESDSRGQTYEYWLRVAQTHNYLYELPTLNEGFDEIHEISFEEIQNGKFFS